MILFTRAAVADVVGIHTVTASTWGTAQAERYLTFLDGAFSSIESDPAIGHEVEGRPGYRVFLAKFSKRRSAHRHRILYRITEEGVEIMRVLHTAMSWPDEL